MRSRVTYPAQLLVTLITCSVGFAAYTHSAITVVANALLTVIQRFIFWFGYAS